MEWHHIEGNVNLLERIVKEWSIDTKDKVRKRVIKQIIRDQWPELAEGLYALSREIAIKEIENEEK